MMLEKAGLLRELSRQHPDLGRCMTKWLPKVESIVREVARLTGQIEEDVLQDVLLEMWRGVEWYKLPIVKWQNHLWEVKQKIGVQLVLEREDRNCKLAEVVDESEVEVPRKSSLYSFVYRGLWQFFLNSVSKHFTQRNGFFQVGSEKKTLVNRWDRKVKEIEIPIFEHRGEVLAFEVDGEEIYSLFDYYPSSSNPEQNVQLDQSIAFMEEHLTPEARRLLSFLLSRDDEYLSKVSLRHKKLVEEGKPYSQYGRGMIFSDATICSYMGCSRADLSRLRTELVDALPAYFLNYSEVRASVD